MNNYLFVKSILILTKIFNKVITLTYKLIIPYISILRKIRDANNDFASKTFRLLFIFEFLLLQKINYFSVIII